MKQAELQAGRDNYYSGGRRYQLYWVHSSRLARLATSVLNVMWLLWQHGTYTAWFLIESLATTVVIRASLYPDSTGLGASFAIHSLNLIFCPR